jgi:RNA polymerase sigma-70 factor (ECF subfamily)
VERGSIDGMSGRPEETERDLIARAQRGDRHAFGELVARHRTGVFHVVVRLCGDADLAEDAAQEAFIRAWQNLPSYRPRAPFRNWVYRIATNVALDALRRQKETVHLDGVRLAGGGPGPEAVVEGMERKEVVRRAVLALPPSSRAVLVLREYEDMSYREIADTLAIPMGTVMSRLNYARRRLRESLAPYLEAR